MISGQHSLRGGVADPHGDHRLAMALALIGLISEKQVKVMNAEILRESFPAFPEVLRSLGANLVIGHGED